MHGNLDMVYLLLDYDTAEVLTVGTPAAAKAARKERAAAIMVAAQHGHADVLEAILRENGEAPPPPRSTSASSSSRYSSAPPPPLPSSSSSSSATNGCSAVYVAAFNGHADAVACLASYGADLDAPSARDGLCPT